MSTKEEKEQYNAIDIAKFLCSIMVIMIHIPPFGTNCKFQFLNFFVQRYAARISVPFFFVASGFFLYKKTDKLNFEIKFSKEYIFKILKLYIIWTIIYFPLSIIDIVRNTKGIGNGIMFYIRDFFLVGSYTHLWYLNATIVAVAIISLLLYKKCKIKNIVFASMLLYAIGLLGQSWFGAVKYLNTFIPYIELLTNWYLKVFDTTRNGLFEGFLFVSIGMIFAFVKIEMSMVKAILGFLASYLLMFFEFIFVNYYNLAKEENMYIFWCRQSFLCFKLPKTLN